MEDEDLNELTKAQLIRYIRDLNLAEEELSQRIALAKRGQLLGFCSLLVTLGAMTGLGLAGHDWLAAGLGGATLISIVGIFVNRQYEMGRRKQESRGSESGMESATT